MSVLVQDRVVIAPPYHELSVHVEQAARNVRDGTGVCEWRAPSLSRRESCTAVQREFEK